MIQIALEGDVSWVTLNYLGSVNMCKAAMPLLISLPGECLLRDFIALNLCNTYIGFAPVEQNSKLEINNFNLEGTDE